MALFRPALAFAIALALPLAAAARVSSDTTPGANFAQVDKHVAQVMEQFPARTAA